MTQDGLDSFIENDIMQKISASPWRKLDTCFKWMKLKEYMLSKGALVDDPRVIHVKTLLSDGVLKSCVEYDTANLRILKLNLTTDEICNDFDEQPINFGG